MHNNKCLCIEGKRPFTVLHYCKYQLTEGELEFFFVYGKHSPLYIEKPYLFILL